MSSSVLVVQAVFVKQGAGRHRLHRCAPCAQHMVITQRDVCNHRKRASSQIRAQQELAVAVVCRSLPISAIEFWLGHRGPILVRRGLTRSCLPHGCLDPRDEHGQICRASSQDSAHPRVRRKLGTPVEGLANRVEPSRGRRALQTSESRDRSPAKAGTGRDCRMRTWTATALGRLT